MTIAITFCGGARTVTGSMHVVSTNRSNLLLDCGLFYGRRDEFYSVNSYFPFDPADLDACVLSHAHIDHSGNIPNLIKKGFASKVYCTPTTRDLSRYMLTDSGFIQEEDIKYVNKINKRRGIPSRSPLYTKKDADRSLKYFRPVDYHREFQITKDMKMTLYDAGHILGSALVCLDVGTSKKSIRIGYAVDLGRVGMPLLRDPEVPGNIDYLILESTYGGRRHGSFEDAERILADTINRTIKRGGKIIIPSFALERTQLIVYFISELMKKRKIRKIPIYVDGPLAVNLTEVFRKNWHNFDEETQEYFRNNEDPLAHDNITYIKQVNQSKRLNDIHRPSIIISSSGMCENGRILHHLKNNIENSKNTIIVIGFMAKDTLGRRIVEKNETVRIFGRQYDLSCEVVVVNAFSSHADNDGLVNFVKKCGNNLKQIFIVHGDPENSEMLRNSIRRATDIKPRIPSKGETVYLRAGG